MASNLKRPELKLVGNISENFKNFELRFDDYCVQADYRDLTKDPHTEKIEYFKKPQLEIAALRSAMPDEALQVIRYTIEPQIADRDKTKPWVWMEKLRTHYTGSVGSALMTDRFKFWNMSQTSHESVQDWEVKVRQAGSLCEYAALMDEMCKDKFVFGLGNKRKSTLRRAPAPTEPAAAWPWNIHEFLRPAVRCGGRYLRRTHWHLLASVKYRLVSTLSHVATQTTRALKCYITYGTVTNLLRKC